jgi:YfiH family protein
MLRSAYCESKGYLVFEELEEISFLFHLFTIKQSGPPLVSENRKLETRTLLDCLHRSEKAISLKQRHGNQIHWISEHDSAEVFEGDGLITGVSGRLLIVQTADCLPLLLVDPRRKLAGTLHVGWRGTLANITGTAIRQMLERGSAVNDLIVAFGPSIGSCCYEVGPEVLAAFQSKFAEADSFFVARPDRERKFLDLRKANYAQATRLGLNPNQILWNAYCTQCDSDMFFSYRREGARTGRMFALIGIQ